MRAVRLLLVRTVLTGVALLAPGAGGGGRMLAQAGHPADKSAVRVDHAGRVLPAGIPAAPVVPPGAPDAATAWLATTHPHLSVLFSYHREEGECAGRCEQYGLWLRYAAPSGGAPAPPADWRTISQVECVDFWVDHGQDLTCVSSGGMAGRDRHGNDYVLLPMYASRVQLERLLTSRTLARFQLGNVSFHLTAAGRDSLRSFLAAAGRPPSR